MTFTLTRPAELKHHLFQQLAPQCLRVPQGLQRELRRVEPWHLNEEELHPKHVNQTLEQVSDRFPLRGWRAPKQRKQPIFRVLLVNESKRHVKTNYSRVPKCLDPSRIGLSAVSSDWAGTGPSRTSMVRAKRS